MEVTNIPISQTGRVRPLDGEGSVQVELDPSVKIGKQKYLRFTGRVVLAKVLLHRIYL